MSFVKSNEEKIFLAVDSLDANFANFSNKQVNKHKDILAELRNMNQHLYTISQNIYILTQK